MPFSTLGLSVATVGAATLAFAIAAPASAQEHYGQRHYTHARIIAHARLSPLRPRYGEGRQIVVHPQCWRRRRRYVTGPVGAVGSVVGGTGHAVESGLYRRRRNRGRGPRRRSRRRVGAVRRSWLRLLRQLVRGAVQCGRHSRGDALPGGQRRNGRAGARRLRLRAGGARARVLSRIAEKRIPSQVCVGPPTQTCLGRAAPA